MNFNSPLNFQQNLNLAFLLSSLNNVNQTLMSSSPQEQTSFPFMSLSPQNSQNQSLFQKLLTAKTEKSFSPEMQQENLTTSPSSIHSHEGTKASLEEESEINTNIHSKKPIFTITRQNKLLKSNSAGPEGTKASVSATTNYNRKEKSLCELSKKFLGMFGRIKDCVISLDSVTKQLDVERRRVYDIINILESLGVVYRKGKNNYQWNGLEAVKRTIERLENRKDSIKQEESGNDDSSSDEKTAEQRLANKKEKSLAFLAGSFIKLFFSWKNVIPLEEAAWKLSPSDSEEHKIKTKVRRLYDIANVFSSLGLIKKTCLDSKKPAFQWVGNRGLDELIESLNGSPGKPIVSTEKSTKKNLVKNEAKVHKKEEKFCQTPMTSVSENNSALKAPTTKEDKLDNFMNMILELCQQAQASSKLPYQNSFSHLFGQSNFTPNLSYQNLAFNQYAHFYQLQNNLDNTRVFQNTVPKKISDFENPTTSDRRRLGNIDSVSSMNIKRPAPHSIEGFENSNMKKIHSIGQINSNSSFLMPNSSLNKIFGTKVEN